MYISPFVASVGTLGAIIAGVVAYDVFTTRRRRAMAQQKLDEAQQRLAATPASKYKRSKPPLDQRKTEAVPPLTNDKDSKSKNS